MVKDTGLEYPKSAEKWPALLGMVKIMQDLPDPDNEAGQLTLGDFLDLVSLI